MAKSVKQIPSGRRSYPWSRWLDGGVWELRQGEDFDCEPKTFVQCAGHYRRRKGLEFKIAKRGDVVYIQAPVVSEDTDG